MRPILFLLLYSIVPFTLISQIYQDISVPEANALIQERDGKAMFTILDVRTQSEYDNDHLADADTRDFYANNFAIQLDSLDKCRAYLIYCASGNRSGQAFTIMQNLGFEEVYNMLGGISTWKAMGMPVTSEVPELQNIYQPQLIIKEDYIELLPELTANQFIITGDFSNYSVVIRNQNGMMVNNYSSSIHPISFDLGGSISLPLIIDIQSQMDPSRSVYYLLE